VLRDRNLAMPLDRLREMHTRGEIGALAPQHYSFMGSIASRILKLYIYYMRRFGFRCLGCGHLGHPRSSSCFNRESFTEWCHSASAPPVHKHFTSGATHR
jgi:hypothetical protein